MRAQKGGGGTVLTQSQADSGRWVVSTALWPLYPREMTDTHCAGGWVGLGVGLDGTEILSPPPAPRGIHSPDRPAHKESLY
jgi:hypothetical protein